MPVDVHHRKIGRQREFLVEAALQPLPSFFDPVTRRLRLPFPVPSLERPEIAAGIAAVANEFQKLSIRDRRAGNAKGFELDSMSPFFIVEMTSGVSRRADQKFPAGQFGVSVHRALPCIVSV